LTGAQMKELKQLKEMDGETKEQPQAHMKITPEQKNTVQPAMPMKGMGLTRAQEKETVMKPGQTKTHKRMQMDEHIGTEPQQAEASKEALKQAEAAKEARSIIAQAEAFRNTQLGDTWLGGAETNAEQVGAETAAEVEKEEPKEQNTGLLDRKVQGLHQYVQSITTAAAVEADTKATQPHANLMAQKARVKAAAKARLDAQERAKEKVREEAKAQVKAKAKVQAQAKAQAQATAQATAEARAQEQAKAKAQARAQERAKAKAEARADARKQERAKATAEAKAQAKVEARAQEQAQEKVRAQAQTQAKVKAHTKATKHPAMPDARGWV